MKKNIKKFLLEKEVKKWFFNHKELMNDVSELAHMMTMFKVKYGIPLEIVYDDKKDSKDRSNPN